MISTSTALSFENWHQSFDSNYPKLIASYRSVFSKTNDIFYVNSNALFFSQGMCNRGCELQKKMAQYCFLSQDRAFFSILTGQRNRKYLGRGIVGPYTTAIRNDFILMCDNSRSYRPHMVDVFFFLRKKPRIHS